MFGSVFSKSLWERRRAVLWWSVGVVALVGVTVLFYPSVRDSAADFQDMLDQLPEAVRTLFVGNITDLSSPIGYLNSQIFATNGPILLLILAIGRGSRAIAGEEQEHTLDLLLSTPVSRRRVVVQKFGALVVEVVILGAVLWGATAASAPAVGLDVPLTDLAAATLHMVLFAIGFGAIALSAGCATGRRAAAIGVGSVVAVAAFLLNSLAPLSASTEPLQRVSPLYHATGTSPLLNGADVGGLAVLAGIAVVALGLAVRSFDGRDLRV